MGNDQSSPRESSSSNGFMSEFSSNYDFYKEVNDKRFGDICVYRHRQEKKYICKRGHMCNSADEYAIYMKSCMRRQSIRHKSILQLLHFQEANEDNICGDFNKITIYFEYYTHDLEKELHKRRDNSPTTPEFFSESELWYLLDSLVSACSCFEKYKIYHGDLRPSNILLTQEGLVKIADHGIFHIDHSGYFKMLSRGDSCYLSPTLLRSLGARELKPYHDQWKSDVYSLGMTLLEAATLCPPACAYDYNQCQVQHQIVEDLLQACRQRYSEFFVNVLRDMLIEDEHARPSFENISSILQPVQVNTQAQQQVLAPYSSIVPLQQSVVYLQPSQTQQQQQQQPQQQQQFYMPSTHPNNTNNNSVNTIASTVYFPQQVQQQQQPPQQQQQQHQPQLQQQTQQIQQLPLLQAQSSQQQQLSYNPVFESAPQTPTALGTPQQSQQSSNGSYAQQEQLQLQMQTQTQQSTPQQVGEPVYQNAPFMTSGAVNQYKLHPDSPDIVGRAKDQRPFQISLQQHQQQPNNNSNHPEFQNKLSASSNSIDNPAELAPVESAGKPVLVTVQNPNFTRQNVQEGAFVIPNQQQVVGNMAFGPQQQVAQFKQALHNQNLVYSQQQQQPVPVLQQSFNNGYATHQAMESTVQWQQQQQQQQILQPQYPHQQKFYQQIQQQQPIQLLKPLNSQIPAGQIHPQQGVPIQHHKQQSTGQFAPQQQFYNASQSDITSMPQLMQNSYPQQHQQQQQLQQQQQYFSQSNQNSGQQALSSMLSVSPLK